MFLRGGIMNNKGFMMAEVVVVSSVIIVTLVALYSSYNKIFLLYNQRVNYYDVSTLYELANIRDYELDSITFGNSSPTLFDSGTKTIFYINKYDVDNINTTSINPTFKDYLLFLTESLDYDSMTYGGVSVNNILIMENCKTEDNCKYAYLEVPNET